MDDSTSVRQHIIAFLSALPNVHGSEGRRALLLQAGLDTQVSLQVNWDGPSSQFFPLLVETLLSFGTLPDGRHALEALLVSSKQQIGQNKQTECDTLLQHLSLLLPQTPFMARRSGFFPLESLPEPGLFVNRKQLQADLTAFFLDATRKAYILHGMGGIGKTSVLAKVLQEQYPDELVYWHTCTEDTQIERVFGELHTFLTRHQITVLDGIWNNPAVPFSSRLHAVIHGFSHYDRGALPFLLIFDDLQRLLDRQRRMEHPELQAFFEGLFTKRHAAKILLSSRFMPVIARIPGGTCQTESLMGLTLDDSLVLLQRQGVHDTNAERLRQVVTRVDGHPLGLVVMGQLWERGFPIDDLLTLPVATLAEESGDPSFLTRLLTKLWPSLTSEEREVLTILTIYRHTMPLEAIQWFFEDPITRTVLHLTDCSLLQKEGLPGNVSYSVHALLRDYLITVLTLEQQHAYHHKAAAYWESLEWDENPTQFGQLQERIECRWHYAQAEDYEKATRIAFPLAVYLESRCGLYKHALNIILETQGHITSEEDQATCDAHIGAVYDSQGNYEQALRYYEKSREIQERLGLEVDLATTYWNLGLLYFTQGNLAKAEEFVSQTVQIEEKIGHPDLAQDKAELERIRALRHERSQ